VKIKQGADIKGLKIEMRPVLVAAEMIWRHHGQELVVTSGLEGTHSAGSLHYYGYALDLRSKYFTGAEKASVVNALRAALGGSYDVVSHPSHIHVEFDREV
jgi:hypothetical protein